MQRILLIGLLLFISAQSNAQEGEKQKDEGTIAGHVTDSSSKKPIEYATITLFRDGNKKAVNGAVTDNNGQFNVASVDPGTYKVVVESVGYQPYTINAISISKKDPVVKLPTISLAKTQVTLQNVTVTSSAPLIENKIDKMVFNAEKDVTSQGGVATDVLKKIPQVSVDVDGNVELAGSTSIKFLINGKPSTAFGSSITDVLQSIPASQIKSIEVITNPGAKYDAQGLGGIINIILKQSKVKGINGNLSLAAGTRNENGSFNFNARKGDIGFNAFVSGNSRLAAISPTTSERLSADTAAQNNISLQQDGTSRIKRHGIEAGFGVDWTYKKKNNFTGSFRYGNWGSSSMNTLNQLQVITAQNGGSILSSITSINNTNNQPLFHSFDFDFNYKRTFAKEDQELEISANSSFDKGRGTAGNYQLLLPQDSLYYGTNSSNPGHENETEIAVDYTKPLKEDMKFGIGAKWSSPISTARLMFQRLCLYRNYTFPTLPYPIRLTINSRYMRFTPK
jgi:ferric enterobactin receptor